MKGPKTNLNPWQKFREAGKWFGNFSSLSGISQYRISDNRVSKACWISLYWLGIAFTFVLVEKSFRRYLSHPHVTKMERKNNFASPFPSVTICNPNRVHCKHLYSRIKTCHKVQYYIDKNMASKCQDNFYNQGITLQQENSCSGVDDLCYVFLIAECRVSLQMAKMLLKSTANNDWNEICNKSLEYYKTKGRIVFQILIDHDP